MCLGYLFLLQLRELKYLGHMYKRELISEFQKVNSSIHLFYCYVLFLNTGHIIFSRDALCSLSRKTGHFESWIARERLRNSQIIKNARANFPKLLSVRCQMYKFVMFFLATASWLLKLPFSSHENSLAHCN